MLYCCFLIFCNCYLLSVICDNCDTGGRGIFCKTTAFFLGLSHDLGQAAPMSGIRFDEYLRIARLALEALR